MFNSVRKNTLKGILLAIGMSSTNIHAQAFTECPTEAFLIQDKLANLYGVQLATGFYEKNLSFRLESTKNERTGFQCA